MAKKDAAKQDSAADGGFPFIVSCGPKAPKDGAVRTLIRKQAMKDVGLARRKRGNYGRVNMRQPVVVVEEEETNDRIESTVADTSSKSSNSSPSGSDTPSSKKPASESTAGTEWSEQSTNQLVLTRRTSNELYDWSQLLPSLSCDTAYERTRAKFCVDIPQLSILTSWSVSRSAIPLLSADPLRLFTLMEEQTWSFLEYIPQMYESNKCLAAATDCVLAKASEVLTPYPASPGQTMKMYAKALRMLQDSISDPCASTSAEVLAATQLMALHELLDTTRIAAWTSHIKGSMRLVRHRSPGRFKSEFEKALFTGHIGPVTSECLITDEPCYLDQPEWLDLYTSLAEETNYLTDRTPLVINTRKLMIKMPTLWHDVGKVMDGDDLFNDDALAELEDRLRKLHQEYLDWLEEYKSYCVASSLRTPLPSEVGLRRQIFGETIECLVLVKRLLAIVCDQDRIRLETEVQALARLIIDLQQQQSHRHSWLFTGHEVGVAHTAMVTREHFEEDLSHESVEVRRLASRKLNTLWSGTLRSTV
ncbi:hypothetical protein M409DRAFT_18480 [Zasmidium cellare ATCC 36951]|uniref:Uncharacterized protein n=1 Tax=Zasmidium cellare ATCC 36951 TaxID=1080233 RepID=A0A6A6CW46_ZASCE|nr:uncharacterized protein M409DRAFT_18480 [Zasmidium cellare ATCC 36951]KAF2171364.1 hypothetical protein M409DRAFT_18480 [Zasmidium cellare ATCC 36951]